MLLSRFFVSPCAKSAAHCTGCDQFSEFAPFSDFAEVVGCLVPREAFCCEVGCRAQALCGIGQFVPDNRKGDEIRQIKQQPLSKSISL